MDFGDIVHKALKDRQHQTQPGSVSGDANGDPPSTASTTLKPRPPVLSLLTADGVAPPSSAGSSPAASRSNSPARAPLSPSSPTSPSRRVSYNPFHPSALAHPDNQGYFASVSHPSSPAAGSPTSSRAPSIARSRRPGASPPAVDYYLPPPTVSTGPPGQEGLGLDTPRPKHRSQASFDWFAVPAGGLSGAVGGGGGAGAAAGLPAYLLGDSASSTKRRTDSPARMDTNGSLSRSSSASTSATTATPGGGNGSFPGLSVGTSGLNGAAFGKGKNKSPLDRRGRSKRGSMEEAVDGTLTEESEWEDDARSPVSPTTPGNVDSPMRSLGLSGPSPKEQNAKRASSSAESPRSPSRDSEGGTSEKAPLRGAFTASDLERGARRLMGGDAEPEPSTSHGHKSLKHPFRSASLGVGTSTSRDRFDWKRRASNFPSSFRSSSTAKADVNGSGSGGKSGPPTPSAAEQLTRAQSAGAVDGPGSGVASPKLVQQESFAGKARSIHAGAELDAEGAGGEEWEDEVRDQFDAEAGAKGVPPTPSTATAGRPSYAGRKSSLWGSLGNRPGGAAGVRGGGTESGASTPRGDLSESEADGGVGGGDGMRTPKRPAFGNATSRRGSAWNVVRQKLQGDKAKKRKEQQGASLTGHELISELTTGVLPLVLVKMAVMDRDERGDRRIPILMNYLKLRITDSVYPFHDKHAIFRIELEYGDGAVKWVIYRELKDFVNLHAHYRVANLRQGIDKFPTFPKTSLPYLNWLKTEKGGKGGVGKAEFARAQREALENYLLKLIKATMFGPGANRLCKFLEISAMSIMLSTRGGEQGKQGYLRITSGGASRKKQSGFHPLQWKNRHEPKWFIVRDSYIVAVDDPASTEIYEVIMVDATFEIERPTRVFRKGFNLLHNDSSTESLSDPALRAGAMDLLADEKHPQGRHGAGDPNDPSSTKHRAEMERVKEKAGGGGEKEEEAIDRAREKDKENEAKASPDDLKNSSNHTFYLRSSERKLRLVAKTERQQDQFIASIEKMLAKTIWAGRNRFDSFAPIRLNVAAQWLIDGRDYFWSLSRAISLAKHKIFIHDWWLSPELYLRRPPIDNEKWRLDNLLKRKAEEGVQVFVIVYKEVSDDFTPVDSNYTKTRLRGLHPNIMVQRSPSHTRTGTLLWSHHEKMCVIDETIGFMGGLDLCFGRWDTPGHVLIDDGPNPFSDSDPQNADRDKSKPTQIWPGKDYSNQRVLDFHTLNKPEEDMYDRGKVPRQPWHDIGLQIIGQPARDLCRHFIQRWNYLLRTKNHTVKMPFLLPAPDFTPQQLQELRITGTCEVQICRSVGPWSMGISHVEHSIQNAYIKAIQLSDHFVYIENQFFITSTEVEGTVVENKIGDALVSRIIRAHSEDTAWRCVVVVPAVPGYPYPLDHSGASSVRLIMECQYASICRGEHSIFARLRREGIDPDEYISFFCLRAWGKLSSGALTTESTYIHAKGMVVDDRIAIIGSANINERSQRGDRDSELACIIRDTDMIDSTMGGKPYKVGRFAHTMRVRLMREHLGIDVDELEAAEGRAELESREPEKMQEKKDEWDPDQEQSHGTDRGAHAGKTFRYVESAVGTTVSYAGDAIKGVSEAATRGLQIGGEKVASGLKVSFDDAENAPPDTDKETNADRIVQGQAEGKGFASTVVPTLEEKVMSEHRPPPDATEEGGVRKLRQAAEREREEGPTTSPPAEAREPEEQHHLSERISRPPKEGDGPKTTSQDADSKSSSGVKSFDDKEKEAATRRLGDKVTQSSDLDDTRKIPMQKREERIIDPGKDAPPLSPIDEDGGRPTDLEGNDQSDERMHKEKEAGTKIEIADPDVDSAPPDISNAGKHQQQNRHRSRSTSTAASSSASTKVDSNKAHGNEQAVNRNEITGKLRRNLRERGAYSIPLAAPKIDPYGFSDPLVDSFYKDVWLAASVRNTQIYRKVFRCMPDDLVQTWKQYREFQNWTERHNKAPKGSVPAGQEAPHSDPHGHSGQQGAGGGGSAGGVVGQGNDEPGETIAEENKKHHLAGTTAPGSEGGVSGVPGAKEFRDYTQRAKDYATGDNGAHGVTRADGGDGGKHDYGGDGGDQRDDGANGGDAPELERHVQRGSTITRRARSATLAGVDEHPDRNGNGSSSNGNAGPAGLGQGGGGGGAEEKKGRKRSATTSHGAEGSSNGGGHKAGEDLDDAFPQEERDQMEELLEEVTGQLVVFPTRFLEAESLGGNFLFSKDRIPPLAIYD